MAYIYELWTSGSFNIAETSNTSTLKYMVKGSNNEEDVRALVETTAPATHVGNQRLTINAEPLGNGIWDIVVTYGVPRGSVSPAASGITGDENFGGGDPSGEGNPDAGGEGDPTSPPTADEPPDMTESSAIGSEWNFDISTESLHITRSIQTISSTKAGGGMAPATNKIIGLTRDKIDGCDILTGTQRFSITERFPSISIKFMKLLGSSVAKTNKYDWKGFSALSILFLGVSGSGKTGDDVSLTFNFALGENRTDIEIASDLIVPSKSAHDYLWVAYRDAIAANELLQKPAAAYVEQVYYSMDFRKLGIGK